jgi:Serine protease inhibitor
VFGYAAGNGGWQYEKQILDFIGMDEESVRATYKTYYEVLCMNTDDAHLFMSNSAWFNDLRGYNEQTVSNIADYYYADIFNANFKKGATKRQMQQWLKDNSDNAFGSPDDVGSMDCIIKLFSVLDFLSKWADEPDEIQMPFTPDGGNERSVDGLNFNIGTGYQLDGMSIGRIPFKNGYSFTAILPEDGNTVIDVLSDASLLSSAFDDMKGKTVYGLKCKMPKFQAESNFNLIPTLTELGMSDMFNASADFSNISESGSRDFYVSEMVSKVLIEVDEHGCKAKAMVRADLKDSAMVNREETLYLTLDEPFIYAITYDNVPLFIGLVQNP